MTSQPPPNTTDIPEYVKPFTFHGLALSVKATSSTGACPFCDEQKFSVKNDTGQFICGGCHARGNASSFVRYLWEQSSPTGPSLDRLAAERECTLATLQHFGARASLINGVALLPIYNHEPTPKLVNLYRVTYFMEEGKQKIKPQSTPGLNVYLYGAQHLKESTKRVWLVEGPWKTHAWTEVLQSLRAVNPGDNGDLPIRRTTNIAESLARDTIVLGVNGVRSFKKDYKDFLGNREVFIAYDNDHPKTLKTGKTEINGYEWSLKTASIISSPKKKLLAWGKAGYNPDYPSGYDLRDLRRDKGAAAAYLSATAAMISPPKEEKADPTAVVHLDGIECVSFEALAKVYEEAIYVPRLVRMTLAISLAVNLSTEARNNHLWFRILGPPGVGKSTIAEAMTAAAEYCYAFSLTSGFHSGWVDPSKPGEDASHIPQMNGKTVICKDADTIVQSPNCHRVMSELRDIYDSVTRAKYRNFKDSEYSNLRITFLLCGTDVLKSMNDSMLGERFLNCEIYEEGHDRAYVDRAIDNEIDELRATFQPTDEGELAPEQMLKIKQYTIGYLQYLHKNRHKLPFPDITKEQKRKFESVATLLSYARARTPKEADEIRYRSRKELGTRLGKQFTRLAVCLTMVLNKSEVDDEIMGYLTKVLEDTSEGHHYEVIKYLAENEEADGGKTYAQIARALGIADSNIRRILAELQTFKIVKRDDRDNRSGVGGRNLHTWIVTPDIAELYSNVYPNSRNPYYAPPPRRIPLNRNRE